MDAGDQTASKNHECKQAELELLITASEHFWTERHRHHQMASSDLLGHFCKAV